MEVTLSTEERINHSNELQQFFQKKSDPVKLRFVQETVNMDAILNSWKITHFDIGSIKKPCSSNWKNCTRLHLIQSYQPDKIFTRS